MGMNISFDAGANPDVAAFHEAFADLVPLFQHFWPSDGLRAQISGVRGYLSERSSLGAVAPQFGQAIGRPAGIRNAFGKTDEHGVWHPRQPDPMAYRKEMEPHDRGDLLVGAVFDAFNKIYESRVEDLRRIATRGSGILPQGMIHPDLVNRFMREASRAADQVLAMCIRALDYMPPLDVTFGDFLRAVITADYDLASTDSRYRRVAFLDAFRRYGIFPRDVGTLSLETLLWPAPASATETEAVSDFVNRLSREQTYWTLPPEREEQWHRLQTWKRQLHERLQQREPRRRARLGRIEVAKPFEVLSLVFRERPHGVSGTREAQWVVRIVQPPGVASSDWSDTRRAVGCTLIVDADSGRPLSHRARDGRCAHGCRRLDASGAREEEGRATGGAGSLRHPRQRGPCRHGPAARRAASARLRVRSQPWRQARDLGHQRGRAADPVGARRARPRSSDRRTRRRVHRGCGPRSIQRQLLCAGQPESPAPARRRGTAAVGKQSAVPSADGVRGGDANDSSLRGSQGNDGRQHWREDEFVSRLRLYPHALREANAYYSPAEKAILFGYFPALVTDDRDSRTQLTVFTCLSHDIIAHEVTHALLDGMHREFNEPTNPDVLAFHEAFADLVALFLHFSLPNVLRHQIAASRGDLASQNRLGELAQQFGQAIGKRGALRSAIGQVDEQTGEWKPSAPDPGQYRRQFEPHARGAILVAAVFDAFLTLYKNNVSDLLRLASEGTGVLPAGQLHPDLVNRLSAEAAGAAGRMLHMCIRALDYCPPVDISFGDYLRAMLTANFEHDPEDEESRCVAVVEAFRRYGIVPDEVRTLSVDGLLWRPMSAAPDEDEDVVLDLVKTWVGDIAKWNVTKSRRALFRSDDDEACDASRVPRARVRPWHDD
jgi:hypothetical protein